jgi:chaperonin cofactor prefoldin
MDLSISKLSQLQTQLETYRTEGYQIASQIKDIGYYSASAASLMLSKDFN